MSSPSLSDNFANKTSTLEPPPRQPWITRPEQRPLLLRLPARVQLLIQLRTAYRIERWLRRRPDLAPALRQRLGTDAQAKIRALIAKIHSFMPPVPPEPPGGAVQDPPAIDHRDEIREARPRRRPDRRARSVIDIIPVPAQPRTARAFFRRGRSTR